MKQAIYIFCPEGRDTRWLNDLLETFQPNGYPWAVTSHIGWQIEALENAFKHSSWDEIFFLNDTMIVKDNSIWDIVFQEYKGQSVMIGHRFQMFLAKYLRKYVEQTTFPRNITSRREDVIFGEDHWNVQYMNLDPNYVTIEEMSDPNPDLAESHDFRYDRDNVVLENKYFKKWKHHWNIKQIK